jgi:hypothetical protein
MALLFFDLHTPLDPCMDTMQAHESHVADEKASAGSFREIVTASGIVETSYVGLSRWRVVRTFWKASLFSVLAAVSGMNDG